MKIKIIIIATIHFFILGCQKDSIRKKHMNPYHSKWYKKHLIAMKEPMLSTNEKSNNYFVYRVLYLPTWGKPLCIRIETSGEKVLYRAIMLSGEGGYEPGTIKDEVNKVLNQKTIDELVDKLTIANFWEIPKDKTIGLDGTQLIIEVIKNRKYTVVDQWTPEYKAEERGLQKLLKVYTKQFESAGFLKELGQGK